MFQALLRFMSGGTQTKNEPISPPLAANKTALSSSEGSLPVLMCRFNGSRLERSLIPVGSTEYFAISHVWGLADWRRLPIMDSEVLVSEEKAKFLVERLETIVGANYFWMDILCVDQRDKAARIAVTQHIPTIFRFAKKTVMIRDGAGLGECCAQAMDDVETWVKLQSPCRERLAHHRRTVHPGEDLEEVVLSRLWVLQEVVLSDNIQFVRCDTNNRRVADTNKAVDLESLAIRLMSMWSAWAQYGTTEKPRDHDHLQFVHAFFNCGFISRTPRSAYRPHVPTKWEFVMQIWSTRRTTKARDFILAVMPQYSFYTLPENARSMTFVQLFADCFAQLDAAKGSSPWLAQLVSGTVDTTTGKYTQSESIPEPLLLGDLVKLFLGARLVSDSRSITSHMRRGYQAQVEKASDLEGVDLICCIQDCARQSGMLWTAAMRGEIEDYISLPVVQFSPSLGQSTFVAGDRIARALRLLRLCGQYRDQSPALLLKSEAWIQPFDFCILLHAAALVSCGFGLSAIDWSVRNMTPISVKFNGKKYLSLAPNVLFQSDNSADRFYLLEAHRYFDESGVFQRRRFALVACSQTAQAGSYTICFFPPDVNLFGWKVWRNWV